MKSSLKLLKHHLWMFLSCLFLVIIFNTNAQVNCDATTLEEFFDCYGGEQNFSLHYREALKTFINTEDAIKKGDYSSARKLLDNLWEQYPIGSSSWGRSWSSQLGTNIGSPYGYYGLRMMDDIVNFNLENDPVDTGVLTAKMKIVLVGCMQSIQPRTQEELDNGGGEFVTRTIDRSLFESDYRIIRQSIDLFAEYSNAIAKSKLNVDIGFIELPELCLETNINSFATGVYDARPDLGPVWEAIDETTFNETDWWMIISPSAVPLGEDFEDDEFITGGMGADSKGGPLFIADDLWLTKKPYHLGEGNYSDIERRAYLPQWYQHEFYHHLFRIYPEFALEVNGHDWFNRNFWPDDFVGAYEPDYYAESLYKRLQTACDPLENKLIININNTDLALFSEIEINDIIGPYSLDNIGNEWHVGEVLESGNTFFWRNSAGVQWELTPRLSEGYLETGPDCPYPGIDHMIELSTDERGQMIGVVKGLAFNGDFYRKRFNTFFDEIPVELTFGEYTSSISSNVVGDLYEQNQLYYWRDQDDNEFQLVPDFNQGFFEVESTEEQRLELITSGGDCAGEIVLGLKTSDEVFTAKLIDVNNQPPQLLKSFENIDIDNQSVSIVLSEYFEDPESDELTYVVFYDESTVAATVDVDVLNVNPIGVGNSTITMTVIDSNRGAITTEFEITVTDIVLSIDQAINTKIKLYPNPSQGQLNITGLANPKSYSIYNLSGAKVKNGVVKDEIDISDLNLGTYLLDVDNISKPLKFVLMK